MSNMNDESDFLSKLTEETFLNLDSGDYEVHEFDYENVIEFKKIESKHDLDAFSIILENLEGVKVTNTKLDSNTMCYKFNLNNFMIDIPTNWGPFNIVDDYKFLKLDKSNCDHEFISTLKIILEVEDDCFVMIKEKEKLKLLGFQKSNLRLIESLDYIFEQVEIKKAA